MNVLMINGSPKPNGNTAIALREMEQIFVQEGIQVETVHVGNKDIRGCIGCNKCMEAGKCVFDDLVNETAPKFEACDGLVLTGLPYFYAGATASGRGTVQVSVRQGIDYLSAIAHSLLRQGFKRQVYISFHGPAHMTCSPMVRDFFDETGVPILYIDLSMQMFKSAKDLFKSMDAFHAITVGAYQLLGRLEDVPLTTEYSAPHTQTCAPFNDLFALAYQSGSAGYCFADPMDHMPTTAIPDEATRKALAGEGAELIGEIVKRMDMPHVAAQMRDLKAYTDRAGELYPWMPSAYNSAK